MIGKMFLYDNEEWVVEELLLYGHRCKCRSYFSDRTKQFYCDFVQEQIENYDCIVSKESENKTNKEICMDFEKMWYELKQYLIETKETEILTHMDEEEIAELFKKKGIKIMKTND